MMRARAAELLAQGAVGRVLGWRSGGLGYDPSPAFFHSAEQLPELVYNGFCAANLSKYLIKAGENDGRTLVFLKPCDTYGLNQLLSEHRIDRDKTYLLGVGCGGMLDMEKARGKGIKGVGSLEEAGGAVVFQTLYGEKSCPRSDLLLEKCIACKGGEHMAYDELLGAEETAANTGFDRFAGVNELEDMPAGERFDFWRGQLSKCIRCNACRNVCPACSCNQCVFDNARSGVSAKANADSFEENLFHIIRAYHVAGRCTDCGECSRVCPQGIPLHLLNRKLIKDINAFYGPYQAGADPDSLPPLTDYTKEDVEPGVVTTRGGATGC